MRRRLVHGQFERPEDVDGWRRRWAHHANLKAFLEDGDQVLRPYGRRTHAWRGATEHGVKAIQATVRAPTNSTRSGAGNDRKA